MCKESWYSHKVYLATIYIKTYHILIHLRCVDVDMWSSLHYFLLKVYFWWQYKIDMRKCNGDILTCFL